MGGHRNDWGRSPIDVGVEGHINITPMVTGVDTQSCDGDIN